MSAATRRTFALALVAGLALAAGLSAYATGLWRGLEARTVDARFSLRPAHPPRDLLVVAIDDRSIDDLVQHWPFPRSRHATAIDRLRADGARAIVYDIQFTERTTPREDFALYRAVARAGGVVLATSEVDGSGHTNVLGGDANLARAHARAAAASLPPDPGPVIRRYSASALGLPSLAVAGAEATTGRPVPGSAFARGNAWIDFRGPPGTIPTVHFSDLVLGRVDPRLVKGRTVVVGASSPTLGDVHATSTTSGTPMSGPEVQANAIWTALHGNPLRAAPGWLAVLAIALGAVAMPLACRLGLRPLGAAFSAAGLAAGYLAAAQAAFLGGTIVIVIYPLAALALGTAGAIVAGWAFEARERRRVALYAWRLERRLRRGRRELREAQLEIVQRLTQAAESRDEQTGGHLRRIGELCERVGLALGMSGADAERLRHASAMHDVGKIGIPDRILLKGGPLDHEEWEMMKGHTTHGAAILAGSSSPLVQMAETIALTHHERWDGTGYPAGLKGEEIPLVGRICAVCDVFDALVSERPYKPEWTLEQALAQLRSERGTHFDPRVLDAFLALAGELAPVLTGEPAFAAGAPALAV